MPSCFPTRFLNNDQALVKSVKIKGVSSELKEEASQYIQQDIKPNSRFNLALYNTFNTEGGRYRNGKIRNIGEAPHLLDSSLVDISSREIQKFLFYKGYFKAKVRSDVEVKRKRAYITFHASQGPAYTLRSMAYDIADTAVRKLYLANRKSYSTMSNGMRYDADSVMNEINNTNNMLKEHGYYDFMKQFIHVDLDSNLLSNQVDVKLRIYNPPGKDRHKVYLINDSVRMEIRNAEGHRRGIVPDSAVVGNELVLRDYSHRFRARPLTRYIFTKPGEVYSVKDENYTYDRLYELNAFRNLQIGYSKDADSTSLNVRIEATPLKRMSNRIEGEYTFNSSRNGFNIANTYTNRNLFGGAEQLEVKLRYGVLFDSRGRRQIFGNVFNRDFQIGANLSFPRLMVPFRTSTHNKAGISHTTFSTSLQVFDQPNAFRNRLFINSLTYDWHDTMYKLHSLTPVSIEYRDGRLDSRFRDSIRQLGYEAYIRTNDRRYFNLGSSYTFTFNAVRLNKLENFMYFKGGVELGGNTLYLLTRIASFHQDSTGARTFLSLPFLQYTKAEIDFRYYRYLGGEKQLVLRLNPGVAASYGNSSRSGLPFEKNFFAGGFSGVRAWQARTLGPGNYNRSQIGSEEARKNLTYLDQYGDLKLEGNIEYRFKIANKFFGAKLKGAAFTDFGNIWRLHSSSDLIGGDFKFNKFIDQLAIGAGAGLRLDMQYFVFRLDVGAKVKDPQFSGSDQWVIRHLFSGDERSRFKDEYYRTNSPDHYRFLQYNFGIGMPF